VLTNEEWVSRYNARFRDRANWEGNYAADTGYTTDADIQSLREGFEELPEDAADEEMSYWDDDGDADE
jgi:hypothetical protein